MSGLKYYKTIDKLQIWNWFKLKETGDARYLIIRDDYDNLPGKLPVGLKKAFDDINDEFIDRYGFTSREKAIMEKKRAITGKILDMLADDDESHLTAIMTYQKELDVLTKKQPKNQTVYQQAAIITGYFKGVTIDVHNTPVSMFYALADQMQYEVEQLERAKNG